MDQNSLLIILNILKVWSLKVGSLTKKARTTQDMLACSLSFQIHCQCSDALEVRLDSSELQLEKLGDKLRVLVNRSCCCYADILFKVCFKFCSTSTVKQL